MSKNESDGLNTITAGFLRKHDYFRGVRTGTITWTRSGMWGESKSSVGIEVSILSGEGYLRIHYTQTDRDTDEKKDFDYKIQLTTTPCHFGGKRYWFICPWYRNGVYCGRRVGVLYKDGDYFACRHCYELTYHARNINRRYKYFQFFEVMSSQQKMDELESKIKRPYYRGKPTRKKKQLLKLQNRALLAYIKNPTMDFTDML